MTIWSMKASKGGPLTSDPGTRRGYPTILPIVTDPKGTDARDPIVLTGANLSIADVEAVARHGAPVALDPAARTRMQESRDLIEGLVAAGEVVYGVTTGFGDLATRFVAPADAARLQENLLMSHAAGVGEPLAPRAGPGDAPAPGEHPRPRPQRLPARCSSTGCSPSSPWACTRSFPRSARSGRRAIWRRSPTSRCR